MVLNRNGPGEAAVGMDVEGDVRSSDENGVEGGVMSHERHSTDDIIAHVAGRIDDEGKREVESSASTASIASLTGHFVMPLNVLQWLHSHIVVSVGRQLNEASPHGAELGFAYLPTV